MKLEVVKIADSGPRTFQCEGCSNRVTQSPSTPVFADRHGTPFASYYCEHCADAMYFDDERAEREAIEAEEELTFDDTFSRPT